MEGLSQKVTSGNKLKFLSELLCKIFFFIFLASISFSKPVNSLAEVAFSAAYLIGLFAPRVFKERIAALKQNSGIWFLPLIFIIYLIGTCFSTDFSEALKELNRKHVLFTMPIILGTLTWTKKDRNYALGSFLVGAFVALFVSFYMMFIGLDHPSATYKVKHQNKGTFRLDYDHHFTPTVILKNISAGSTIEANIWVLCAENDGLLVLSGDDNIERRYYDSTKLNTWQNLKFISKTDSSIKELRIYGHLLNKSKVAYFSKPQVFLNGKDVSNSQEGKFGFPSPLIQRPRYGLILATSFFIIIFLLVEYGGKENRYKLLIIPAAIVLFALTIADARAGQIGLLIMLISFAWLLSKRQSKNSFALRLVALLFITGVALIYFLVPAIKDSVLLGFNEITNVAKGQELQYSSMGKRVIYYQYYFQIAKENLFFGLGTGSLKGVNQDIFTQHGIRWDKPHNQFLEWVIQFGVIGLSLILLCWTFFVRSFSKKAKEFIIPFTGLMFFSMFFDDTLGTQAGMAIFIGIYSIYLPKIPLKIDHSTNKKET